MTWKKIDNRLWRADGEGGSFFIEKSGSEYWSRYQSKTGVRVIKMPPKKSIKEAKEMCENNYYWEGDYGTGT